MYSSFLSSALAEVIALPFYFPYDLIKTRMQTKPELYNYKNLADAFCKIYESPLKKDEIKMGGQVLTRLRRYYEGMGLYGGGYISFMAIEFCVYESIMFSINERTNGRMSYID